MAWTFSFQMDGDRDGVASGAGQGTATWTDEGGGTFGYSERLDLVSPKDRAAFVRAAKAAVVKRQEVSSKLGTFQDDMTKALNS